MPTDRSMTDSSAGVIDAGRTNQAAPPGAKKSKLRTRRRLKESDVNVVNRPMLKKARLGHIRFHDLRHSHATLLLIQGVHPKIVQGRLGHSRVSQTLDTYSHVVGGLDVAAANQLEAS